MTNKDAEEVAEDGDGEDVCKAKLTKPMSPSKNEDRE